MRISAGGIDSPRERQELPPRAGLSRVLRLVALCFSSSRLSSSRSTSYRLPHLETVERSAERSMGSLQVAQPYLGEEVQLATPVIEGFTNSKLNVPTATLLVLPAPEPQAGGRLRSFCREKINKFYKLPIEEKIVIAFGASLVTCLIGAGCIATPVGPGLLAAGAVGAILSVGSLILRTVVTFCGNRMK